MEKQVDEGKAAAVELHAVVETRKPCHLALLPNVADPWIRRGICTHEEMIPLPCTTKDYRTGRPPFDVAETFPVRLWLRQIRSWQHRTASPAGGFVPSSRFHVHFLSIHVPPADVERATHVRRHFHGRRRVRFGVASLAIGHACSSSSISSQQTHLFPFNRPFCPDRQTRTSPAACRTPFSDPRPCPSPAGEERGVDFPGPWRPGAGSTVSDDVRFVRFERDLRIVRLDCARVVATMSEDEAQAPEGEETEEKQDLACEEEGREDPDAADDGTDPSGKTVESTSDATSPPKAGDGGERGHVESPGKRTESRHRSGVDVFAIPALENIYTRSNVFTRDGRRVREACRKYLGTSTTVRRGARTYRVGADRTIPNARGNRCGIQTKNKSPGCGHPTTRGSGKNIPSA